MCIPTIKQMAIVAVAGFGWVLAAERPLVAGERIYLPSRGVFDECDQPPGGVCDSLCRKFKLQCIYSRRACSQKYVALPYTQPDSTIYLAPTRGPGFGPASPMPVGPSAAYPSYQGNGPAYASPAFAPPGTIFIR